MCFKMIVVVSILTLNLFALVQVQGCKLYCLVCPSDLENYKYYCCMENWEKEPSIKDCEYETTPSPTIPTTVSVTTTPCPTLPPVPTAIPNRCPELGTPSPGNCATYRRLHPNPNICQSDTDCIEPFNVCCADKCFPTKICKTYRAEFGA